MLDTILNTKNVGVIYEDTSLIVLSKPANLLVLPDRYDDKLPNLYTSLKKSFGEIFVVHRIDKETSGVVAFAKTKEAHTEMNKQFRTRQVEKIYQVLVLGNPQPSEGVINLPLSENREWKMKVDKWDGKTAITNYKTLESFKGYSFLEVRPQTGRMHQIRIHMKAIGTPILCDPFYGNGRGFFLSDIKPHYKGKEEELPLLSRTALHAASISFIHPSSNERLNLAAGLPKDMNTVLKYLRKLMS